MKKTKYTLENCFLQAHEHRVLKYCLKCFPNYSGKEGQGRSLLYPGNHQGRNKYSEEGKHLESSEVKRTRYIWALFLCSSSSQKLHMFCAGLHGTKNLQHSIWYCSRPKSFGVHVLLSACLPSFMVLGAEPRAQRTRDECCFTGLQSQPTGAG